MALSVITARLNGLSSDEAVLNGALSLSKAFGGHIDALFARPDPRLAAATMDEGIYPDLYEEMISVMEQQWTEVANKALKHFEKWRSTNQVRLLSAPDGRDEPSAEWRDAIGTETETIGRKGRVSDLVVTAMSSRRMDPRYQLTFEAAVLETGRPVLLVPTTNHTDPTQGKVVVAWNGSPEAFRAVTAAMPILVKASEVIVFTSSEGNIEASMADDLVTYLKWHGAKASVLKSDGKSNSVEDALLAAVRKARASLLVMGAYTHSRFRELLFGGVTRHVFKHATTPVLMAH
jgi:nucleotide-binding universal stress UspA family protein